MIVKVDGATKEMVFFSSRVGFLTHTGTADAEAALLSKLKFLIRGTVGSASGPSLSLVARAVAHPDVDQQFAERRELLEDRWSALHSALRDLPADKIGSTRSTGRSSPWCRWLEPSTPKPSGSVSLRSIRWEPSLSPTTTRCVSRTARCTETMCPR